MGINPTSHPEDTFGDEDQTDKTTLSVMSLCETFRGSKRQSDMCATTSAKSVHAKRAFISVGRAESELQHIDTFSDDGHSITFPKNRKCHIMEIPKYEQKEGDLLHQQSNICNFLPAWRQENLYQTATTHDSIPDGGAATHSSTGSCVATYSDEYYPIASTHFAKPTRTFDGFKQSLVWMDMYD